MKERLTGAIILVVLIVLLVPELLSGPSGSAPAPQSTAQAAATSSEEPPLRSYTIDLADEPRPAASAANTSSASPPQAAGPARPTTIVESPPAQSQQQATMAGTEAPGGSSALGPRTDGQPPSPKTVGPKTVEPEGAPPDGSLIPPASAAAVKAQQMPREQPSPGSPHRTAQASRSNTPETSGDWVVQLGVFAKHANADRLARELKGKGFHTQVSEISVSGRPLWRVRAGPVPERAAAEQLSAKLRTAGHTGSVIQK